MTAPKGRPRSHSKPVNRNATCQLARQLVAELRAIREAQNLTQAQLAKKAGVSQPSVAAFENARRSPSIGLLEKLCHALGQDGLRLIFPGSCLNCGGRPGMRRQCLDCGAKG